MTQLPGLSYSETLDYLYSKLPMFSRVGAAAIKPDLVNTIGLCSFLNDPQNKFKTVHVAGTNGKGSVSHMLAAILQSAGFRTGLYTSPHLFDFRERIKINGKMITEDAVVRFTERIRPMIDKIEPSFFEITVAMAFDHFAEEKVDIAVIETGLGGRLDSTNVIMPELSVITNIGWDHMNLLGDTLEKIAREKAGIIKKGIPVIIGEATPATRAVFEDTAWEKEAPLHFAQEKRKALNWYWVKQELVVEVSTEHQVDHKVYQLDLPGIYQVKNLLTVLEAWAQLRQLGWEIGEKALHQGLQHTRRLTGLHGRWEQIHQSPRVILDVAHNTNGMEQVLQQIEITDHQDLHFVIGMVNDKDVDAVLNLLPTNARYYFTRANIPRAMDQNELASKAASVGLNGRSYPDVNVAIAAAIEHADPRDLVIVCGSVYLIGEVKRPVTGH